VEGDELAGLTSARVGVDSRDADLDPAAAQLGDRVGLALRRA
jgi:hypothetical protein